MAIRRRKKEKKEGDIAKEIVIDMEAVKNAIKTCLDFEKEKGVPLINPKGKAEFIQMYKKYESQNKIKQMVIDTVKDEVKRQVAPLDKKLNTLLEMIKGEE